MKERIRIGTFPCGEWLLAAKGKNKPRECSACRGTGMKHNKEQDRYEECFLCKGKGIVYE